MPPSTTAEAAAGDMSERLYGILTGDGPEDRACASIPEAACTAVPRNYLLNLANGACTKLAEQLASPGLTLPWMLAALGVPASLLAFLSPIKQVGSLLPQMAVAAQIRRLQRRKWAWVAAGVVQGLLLLAIIPAVVFLQPLAAGLVTLLLFTLFSMASGAGSVAFQDVTGKTIPRGRRGRLLAHRAALGGALTLITALGLRFWLGESEDFRPYLWLILIAGLLWLLASLLFGRIEEEPGAGEGGRNMLAEVRLGFGLMRRVQGFRRYLAARVALTSVEVGMPIFVLHAHGLTQGAGALGTFIVAVGLANILSSPIWGRLSDRTARRVMVFSGLLGAAAALLALAVGLLAAGDIPPLLYAPAFLLLGIAEAGARLGRKTYLVDAAPADERPLYVAFSNSLVGIVALLLGGLGILADVAGPAAALLLFAALALAGAWLAAAMPEADKMVEAP
ncbi:MAG TPA: MFS transporter [Kiloniellales bacterium]|nr:MFS transporter [Kiloniellales bacterium]